HEGLVVKSATAPYDVGRRGPAGLKVKPRHTLDLVILGVEWGSGRRRGWLSNLHLGARDPAGGFVMLGKTFKGMTDETREGHAKHSAAVSDARAPHPDREAYPRPCAGRVIGSVGGDQRGHAPPASSCRLKRRISRKKELFP